MNNIFDQYAEKYDSWFMKNQNVLYSELKLVAYFLKDAGDALSVGCGSALFEMFKITGLTQFSFAQTLTRHPVYSNNSLEYPIEGFDRGDYVAIYAVK